MIREGILVKTDKGRGIVPKNIAWQFGTVVVYFVDENLHDEKDSFHKSLKETFSTREIEIVGLVENGKLTKNGKNTNTNSGHSPF